MKLRTAALTLAALLCGHTAAAQTSQRRHPIRTTVVWTLVGMAAGTAIGAYSAWDDDERAAVLQDRMRRRMIVGGSIGGTLGFWWGHRRARASVNPEVRPEAPALMRMRAVALQGALDCARHPLGGDRTDDRLRVRKELTFACRQRILP
jgi:hypothetical protein